MPTKIWERYFTREMLKTFALFIGGFYGVFILIDFACNAARFHAHHVKFSMSKMILYYTYQFIDISEVLVPFALMLATIKTLCQLNVRNELVALLISGVTLKNLVRPFLFIGFIFTLGMYINTEFFVPKAIRAMSYIDNSRVGLRTKINAKSPVMHIALEDKTTLLFQSYDFTKQQFFDAYWIKSLDEIYRIKYLSPYTTVPIGEFVDYLVRNKSGDLVEKAFFATKNFSELKFNKQTLFETIVAPEEQSYTGLFGQAIDVEKVQSEKVAETISVLHRKLAMPWLCFLAVLAPLPFCVRFTRNQQTFMIYAGCIFGLFALFLVIDAGLVLGKRQVVNPIFAVWAPLASMMGIASYRYAYLKV